MSLILNQYAIQQYVYYIKNMNFNNMMVLLSFYWLQTYIKKIEKLMFSEYYYIINNKY